ncbi:NADPH-dependent FMN reductase [Calditerricola satsumensis]|uniref:NADPH-dependent FMN reductase-like domain-containing protein n=1 Tax=Calditerricola satsumensis TaxID=373054 RepID=A0A8J3BH42_9BACI|nr:NADPH-dependent FMN reductase [Calditerricola satsumensis]GGK07505.1 hypothetical protein GCM10007043_21900 [Calditerricola satsumensis]
MNRNLKLLWLADALSHLGTSLYTLVLTLLALQVSRHAFGAGLVLFVTTLPYLVLGVMGGAVVDRFNRGAVARKGAGEEAACSRHSRLNLRRTGGERMNVLILSGSLRNPSHTRALLDEVATLLHERGCRVHLFDLAETTLPPCDPAYHRRPGDHPDPHVRRLVQLADAADAFVWGTPNYHNSYSGALKNALDHLTMDQFRNKPVGLVANSGGMRSTQPLDHLRIVARGLLAVAIPIQVATCDGDYAQEGGGYRLVDPTVKERLRHFVQQLVVFAERLR